MGLLNWMRKGTRGRGTRLSQPQQSHVPTFEQLEPRVLLSVGAFMPLESPLIETPFEAAIYVDLETDQSQCDSVTVERSDSETADGLEDKKLGSEEEKTSEAVEQLNSQAVIPSTSHTVTPSNALPVSQLSQAAELTSIQQNEIQPSLSDASEDLLFHTSHFTPHTSDLDAIQIRGPPTEIVFIDSSLNLDFQLENAVSSDVVVSVLDARQDAISQVASVLSS